MGIRKAGKVIGKSFAKANRRSIADMYKAATRRPSLGQRIKSGARNIVKGIPKGLGIGLAGYGAYNLGKDIAGKFKGKKTAGTTTKKFKNNRQRWASEESYVPQSQRKMYGGSKMKRYAKGGAKPDYIDLDGDGNTTEPMKSTYGHGGPYYSRGRRVPGMYNGM
jgi:hypothetical protein